MEPEHTSSPELVVTGTSPGDTNSTVKSANITNSTSQGAVPTLAKGINSTNQGALVNLPKAPTVVERRGRPEKSQKRLRVSRRLVASVNYMFPKRKKVHVIYSVNMQHSSCTWMYIPTHILYNTHMVYLIFVIQILQLFYPGLWTKKL